jgi:hypothetical protein
MERDEHSAIRGLTDTAPKNPPDYSGRVVARDEIDHGALDSKSCPKQREITDLGASSPCVVANSSKIRLIISFRSVGSECSQIQLICSKIR